MLRHRLTAWPLSALWVWLAAWAVRMLAQGAGAELAWLLGTAVGGALAWLHPTPWRRVMAAAGFPVSALILGGQEHLPAWLWLVLLALLWWLYPRRSWSEAPLFPTPVGALTPLAAHAPLPPGARVLDAGCGLGDGLRELLHACPGAAVEGVEWSRPLAWLARWRVPGAVVRRWDLWADHWAAFALVYVFQRPESMPRVWAKACDEMAEGAWLVSLDFAVPDVVPVASWSIASGQTVWVYRPVRKGAPKRAK